MTSKGLRAPTLLVLGALFAGGVAFAEVAERWGYRFPASNGRHRALSAGSDGAIYWVGTQRQGQFLQRFRPDGTRRYNKRVRGPVTVADSGILPDGSGLFLVGSDTTGDSAWISRYRTDRGRRRWQMTLVPDGYVSSDFRAVAVSADGQSVYAVGSAGADDQDGHVYLAKFTADGDLVWATTHDAVGFSSAGAIAVDPKKEARVCVGGRTGDFTAAPYLEALVACFDTDDGALLWEDVAGAVGGGHDAVIALVITPNGKKLFAAGFSDLELSFEARRPFVQQFRTASGKSRRRIAHEPIDGGGSGEPYDIARTPDGRLYLAVQGCESFDLGPCNSRLLVLNGRGRLQEMHTFGAEENSFDTPQSVVIDSEGRPVWTVDGLSLWLQALDVSE